MQTNTPITTLPPSSEITTIDWGKEPFREPTLNPGDVLLIDEPGRVFKGGGALWGTCYQSHYLRVVRSEYGSLTLLVKHGAGEERIHLDSTRSKRAIEGIQKLDSDTRYSVLYTLYALHRDTNRNTRDQTAALYTGAFLEGRLKRRRKGGRVTAYIADKPITATSQQLEPHTL